MSWATNYERTNNVYSMAMPNMSDGRHFNHIDVDQQTINEQNRKSAGIESNNDYRRYLTKNSGDIIKKNSMYHYSKVGNPVLFADTTPKSNPYLFEGPLSQEKPMGYQGSDLKNHYLSRDQLNLMRSPSIHVPDSSFGNQ